MAVRSTSRRTGTWFVVAGAIVGLALGILVSLTTDAPLAPEAGLLLGAVIGWLAPRGLAR